MHSTPAPKETDPHDTFEIKPDVVLAARADKTSPKPANNGRPSASQDRTTSGVSAGASAPSLDTTFRAAAVDNIKVARDRPATGRWARRALLSFLFALCSAFATAGWTHYGDIAKAMVASWAPRFVLTSSTPEETPAVAEPASSPTLQADAADPAAPPAQSAQSIAAPVAALSPESAQLLQSMSQQIEGLKASIEQLKTGQEQISREIARNSEIKTAQAKTSQAKTFKPRLPRRTRDPRCRRLRCGRSPRRRASPCWPTRLRKPRLRRCRKPLPQLPLCRDSPDRQRKPRLSRRSIRWRGRRCRCAPARSATNGDALRYRALHAVSSLRR